MSSEDRVTIADVEQLRNAANANEAFEVIWSWGWSWPVETRRIVLANNLMDAVRYVLCTIDVDPESDESNSVTARMIETAEVERTYANIKYADFVVDARNW